MSPQSPDRSSVARRVALFAWIFLSGFLSVIMAFSYLLGNEPRILGLPAWVAIGNVLVPIIFVGLLIVLVEKLIPDVNLDDVGAKSEKGNEEGGA